MDNWTTSICDIIEWADGSFDAVYTHDITGDMEFKPATTSQIAAYKEYVKWIEAGRPDFVISMSSLIGGLNNG